MPINIQPFGYLSFLVVICIRKEKHAKDNPGAPSQQLPILGVSVSLILAE